MCVYMFMEPQCGVYRYTCKCVLTVSVVYGCPVANHTEILCGYVVTGGEERDREGEGERERESERERERDRGEGCIVIKVNSSSSVECQ